jgi:hypothetical protein
MEEKEKTRATTVENEHIYIYIYICDVWIIPNQKEGDIPMKYTDR